jgi:glycine/sarcosine N-methyltransferase
MTADPYENFAGRYDLIPDRFAQNDPVMVEFFRRIFSENDVLSILDCACGTGRHLMLFHDLGLEISGSDISAAMLAQARQKLVRYGIKAPLRQADYRDLPQHYQSSIDAVACLGSIGYMPDEKEFLRAFGSMYAVLRGGGLLVLTTIPTDKQWKEKPRFRLVVNTPDVTRLFVMDYFKRKVRYNILDIFHGPEASELKVWSAELTVLLRNAQERLLKAAGFQRVDFFGDFDFNPYDESHSTHLITVAFK